MILLAIETSCDETAIAIVKTNKQGKTLSVLSHNVLSQIEIHKAFGGVFPAIAKREHAKAMVPLLIQSLRDAGLYKPRKTPLVIDTRLQKKLAKVLGREENMSAELLAFLQSAHTPKIDALAVTSGPGLAPALWVGINTALALGAAFDIPVYPINHMEGHILAGAIQKKGIGETYTLPAIAYPAIALLISGGHTEIVLIQKPSVYKILGQTRDDAVGEAFDKVARMLGLPYPGGPEISKLAERARREGICIEKGTELPRPMLHTHDYDFSFSGLKTAVLYRLQKLTDIDDATRKKVSLDFEEAVTEILVKKTIAAVAKYRVSTVIVGGGVSANTYIQKEMQRACGSTTTLLLPSKDMSTDNALMIAITAMTHIAANKKPKKKIIADGNWSL